MIRIVFMGVFALVGGESMKTVLAVILAGGRGTRMEILCQGRPKPALPFAARYQVIDFSLSNCVHSGISDIAVLLDYGRDALRNYLYNGDWWGAGYGTNLQILEPRSGSYEGTADAVYQNLLHLGEHAAELILVLAADHIYQMDYRKMIAFHEQRGADVTVGVIPIPIEQAYRFGIVTTNIEGRIIDFVEKPDTPKGDLASMGIYVFNREVLSGRLMEDAADLSSPHDFGYAVIPKMLSQDKVFAYEFDGYWRDIGTVEAYYEANMDLINEPPSLNLDHNWPVLTNYAGSLPAGVCQEGNLENSIVSRGCIVKGQVEHSILSLGVEVEEHAVVRDSIIMSNTTIGRYSVVDHSILDEEVEVGEFCHIGSLGSLIRGERSITVVGRGAVIPSYTEMGPNCGPLPSLGYRAASAACKSITPYSTGIWRIVSYQRGLK
jgi:glucose-1-phosphate adenylyltransferase